MTPQPVKNQEAAEKSDLTANPVKAVRFSMNVQYPKRNEFFQKQKGFYHDKVYTPAFSFKCSIVQMFFCFLPQSPLFEILASQRENKDFHPHRAPHEEKL